MLLSLYRRQRLKILMSTFKNLQKQLNRILQHNHPKWSSWNVSMNTTMLEVARLSMLAFCWFHSE